LTVNRSGDDSSATQDRGDHGSSAARLAANGGTSVAGRFAPGSIPPSTLVPHEPEIQTAVETGASKNGDQPLDPKLIRDGGAGGAVAAGGNRRVDTEALRFRGADVLTSCSPYEWSAMERAIDRFLEQLSGSDASSLPGLNPVSNLMSEVAVVAAALAAAETLRRRLHKDREAGSAGTGAKDVGDSGFPGLPDRRRIWALEE
jgi:hypothetical protein